MNRLAIAANSLPPEGRQAPAAWLAGGGVGKGRAQGTAIKGLVGAALLGLAAAGNLNAATPEELAGPDVTIIAGEERTIYEYRQNGVLRMVKIAPKWGKPYYLYPRDQTTGFGDLQAADMLLPTWVIVEF